MGEVEARDLPGDLVGVVGATAKETCRFDCLRALGLGVVSTMTREVLATGPVLASSTEEKDTEFPIEGAWGRLRLLDWAAIEGLNTTVSGLLAEITELRVSGVDFARETCKEVRQVVTINEQILDVLSKSPLAEGSST
ncbi:hypothetical protein PHLCEN_2v161 [Hermanssonia centrifuga]|uniref:Uncharacterized protein n=1 Tax=Hermanssonia centrifuga TaxID=98765 RepID=A0A2R6S6R5_9APHY|nr:hypothetical protein PHLCEN_2v161 [Hermanssonia centrifuga]